MNPNANRSRSVRFLTNASIIAALYIVLTILAQMFGLASGVIQIRFSEALTVLPFFTSSAVPGLSIGCFLANLLTGAALPDLIFGPLATLLGALGTRLLRRSSKWLAPVPPVLSNALVIPLVLRYGYGIRPLWFSALTVTLGEILSCGVLGMILFSVFAKYRHVLFPRK